MTSDLRIAHLNLAREFGGGERQTLALIEALEGRINQSVIVREAAPLERQLAALNIGVAAVAGSPFAAVARTRGFDLLHVHEGRSPQTAALRWLMSKTPFVITRRVPQKPSTMAMCCYRRARRIVAVSDAIARSLRLWDSRLPVSTICDCTPELAADRDNAARLRGKAKLVIGQCGALHDAHKGQSLTIDVARRVVDSHPHAEFWLIGAGRDEQDLRRQAADLNNVHFKGWTDRIGDYYAAMDILVYPSHYEGLGSAMLEAMSFGVPVVAARVGGIPEIVEHESNGRLFDPGDAGDFFEQLVPLLQDPVLRQRMGDSASRTAQAHSPRNMAEQYLRIYREIVADRP